MNVSQFFSGASLPPGSTVQMPELAAAGTGSFVTSSNELYVSAATASVVPKASCNPLLPAAIAGANDLALTATQFSIAPFQQAANALASANNPYLISSSTYLGTKGFYVGSTYYLFGPSDPINGMGWISTTDTVNYTPYVALTPLTGFLIVDIFYLSGTWYFLDANGTIVSMTNITTFAGLTFSSLPQLTTSCGYRNITNINGFWYVIGASTTGNGYRVSRSADTINWTIAIESTTGNASNANSICQGAGSGGSTEILISCASDTILKSINNGASFSASAATTGLGGAVINTVFYSSRTGLYYIGLIDQASTANMVAMAVSTTGTLATATWTTTQIQAAVNSTANVNIIDTGTNVGVTFTTLSGPGHYFFYGSSFSNSTPLLTTAQITMFDDTNYRQSAKSIWLNNTLFTVYASNGGSYGARINPMLVTSSGPTCSTGLNVSLWFAYAPFGQAFTQYLWSGASYLAGSYYMVQCFPAYKTAYAGYNFLVGCLFKINSSFTTFSCPVPPASGYVVAMSAYVPSMVLSTGQPTSGATGINWMAYQTGNSTAFNPIFTYNGGVFTIASGITPAYGGQYGMSCGQPIAGQPASCVAVPKWSSLLNTYVMANPAYGYDTNSPYPAIVGTSTTLIGAPTALITAAGVTSHQALIDSMDVLSNGMVVAVTQVWNGSQNISQLIVNNGTVNTNLGPQLSGSYNAYAIWEVVSGGSSYLVYIYQNAIGAYLMNIWKMSTTGVPPLVLSAYPVNNLNLLNTVTNNLRRVFSYNGSFYLGDAVGATPIARNSLMLTPSNGSFTVAPAYLYVGGDFGSANTPNTYTTANTVTTVNPAGVPSVFIAPGAAGSFVKVR